MTQPLKNLLFCVWNDADFASSDFGLLGCTFMGSSGVSSLLFLPTLGGRGGGLCSFLKCVWAEEPAADQTSSRLRCSSSRGFAPLCRVTSCCRAFIEKSNQTPETDFHRFHFLSRFRGFFTFILTVLWGKGCKGEKLFTPLELRSAVAAQTDVRVDEEEL